MSGRFGYRQQQTNNNNNNNNKCQQQQQQVSTTKQVSTTTDTTINYTNQHTTTYVSLQQFHQLGQTFLRCFLQHFVLSCTEIFQHVFLLLTFLTPVVFSAGLVPFFRFGHIGLSNSTGCSLQIDLNFHQRFVDGFFFLVPQGEKHGFRTGQRSHMVPTGNVQDISRSQRDLHRRQRRVSLDPRVDVFNPFRNRSLLWKRVRWQSRGWIQKHTQTALHNCDEAALRLIECRARPRWGNGERGGGVFQLCKFVQKRRLEVLVF